MRRRAGSVAVTGLLLLGGSASVATAEVDRAPSAVYIVCDDVRLEVPDWSGPALVDNHATAVYNEDTSGDCRLDTDGWHRPLWTTTRVVW